MRETLLEMASQVSITNIRGQRTNLMIQTKSDTSSSSGVMCGLLLWVTDSSARFATTPYRQCPQEFPLKMSPKTASKYTLPSKAQFMHDRSPVHYNRPFWDVLINTYHYRWIGGTGPVAWPPRSPDLNHFNRLGQLKTVVNSSSTKRVFINASLMPIKPFATCCGPLKVCYSPWSETCPWEYWFNLERLLWIVTW